MTWESWFTLAVVVAVVVVLTRNVVSPAVVMFGATVVLFVADVIDGDVAFAGFSNPAPMTVAALFVVAAGIERTGALNRLVDRMLGRGSGERRTLARLVVPTMGASAVLNNTPVVAILVPPVSRWSQRLGRSASRYLMPLSFAALLGGTITVIGTSTNIVVSGLLEERGMDALGFFEITPLGLVIAVTGAALLVVLTPVLLPARRPARGSIDDVREFVVEMRVDRGGPLDGTTVEAGGLRHLAGVFLAQLERDGVPLAPVAPDAVLRGGDLLRFVGNARDVADLQGRAGLTGEAQEHVERIPAGRMAFFEAVLGDSSPLVGSSLKEAGFRDRYRAAVLAIHRSGHRIDAKLGEVRLRTGDTLLILAAPGFRGRWHGSSDFLLVSPFDAVEPMRPRRTLPALAIGVGVVLVAGSGLLPIFEASLVGAFAVIAFRVLTPAEAMDSVDLDVIITIAASFGLGAAMTETGLAERLAGHLVGLLDGFGPVGVLLGVAVATMALTAVVSNNAAAVLMFPIAVAAAGGIGADPRAFAVVIAVMASVDFLTPIGYQTNTMVWGPGGYRFGDYARLGLPLSIATLVAVAVVAPMVWSI